MDAEVGKPRVNFLEAITKRVEFDYLHKKQTGKSPTLVPVHGQDGSCQHPHNTDVAAQLQFCVILSQHPDSMQGVHAVI